MRPWKTPPGRSLTLFAYNTLEQDRGIMEQLIQLTVLPRTTFPVARLTVTSLNCILVCLIGCARRLSESWKQKPNFSANWNAWHLIPLRVLNEFNLRVAYRFVLELSWKKLRNVFIRFSCSILKCIDILFV